MNSKAGCPERNSLPSFYEESAFYQMMPWAIIASATFMKPAMLAPFM